MHVHFVNKTMKKIVTIASYVCLFTRGERTKREKERKGVLS